jgi:tRNA(fMet)-specific endonuclease VapC
MFLIDTDISSYAIKSQHGIAAKLLTLQADEWGISVISYHEIAFGLSLQNLSAKVSENGPVFLASSTVFNFDSDAAEAAAFVRKSLRARGKPTGYFDSLIAGHALALDATLVSNNLKHFENVPGLRVENWL